MQPAVAETSPPPRHPITVSMQMSEDILTQPCGVRIQDRAVDFEEAATPHEITTPTLLAVFFKNKQQ